jgi:hypothetical protein
MNENRPASVLDYSRPEKGEPQSSVPLWIADFIACVVAGFALYYFWARLLHKNPATILMALPPMILIAAIWATCRRSSAPPIGIALATVIGLLWQARIIP